MSINRIDPILRENLTEEQYRAATDRANEILCLACAGSGKSRTLAYRIARLIAEGEEPEGIVAFTFTEKAAESIKRRVAEALTTSGFNASILGAMYIGTIHSYCKNLLGEIDAKYRQFDVLDGNRLNLYLISRYASLRIAALRAARSTSRNVFYFESIREISKAWSILNDELLNLDDLIAADPVLGQVLQNLYIRLCEDQFIDFSLMIRLVVEALRSNDPGINRVLQNIGHLMVDEYQDINPAQEALISGIHQRTGTLFVVGDDDQAIYAWRGADVTNILQFNTRYPGCSTHSLSVNFRSTPSIIDSSSRFVARQLGPSRISKSPVPDTTNLEKPRHLGKLWFSTRPEEAEWVADRIAYLLGKSYQESDGTVRGLTPADFAILMASTNTTERDGSTRHSAFTSTLENIGIRYSIEAEGSIFNHQPAQVLRGTFELLRNTPLDRDTVRNHFDTQIVPCFPNADFNNVVSVLTRWNRLIHEPTTGARRKVYPQQLFHELLNAFRIQNTEFDDTQMQVLGIFSRIMQDVESVYMSIDSTYRFREILNFLNMLAEDGYETSPDEVLQRPDAVFVSTVHKAKGLEFPVVFIVDVEHERFPAKRRNYNGWIPNALLVEAIRRGAYQNTRDGDVRLFYTAITRAERYLYVSGSERLPGGTKRWRPSVFTNETIHVELIEDPSILPADLIEQPQQRRIDETIVPTNFSEIRYYFVCPKSYQFRKQYGFSPSVPELFGYGLTVHTSIGKLHELYRNRVPSVNEVEQTTRDVFNLKHVPRSSDPGNSPGPYERALEKAVEITKNYVHSYQHDFTHERQLEVRFEIPACQAVISGSIDLLVKEDAGGNITEATIIDFKSISEPDETKVLDWVELSMQVQLYARAAQEVLGENARTGAVHLLRDNSRITVPISDQATDAVMQNIEWAVDRIINRDYPMRPSVSKCKTCDFTLICPKAAQYFQNEIIPPPIHAPSSASSTPIMIKAFSEFEED